RLLPVVGIVAGAGGQAPAVGEVLEGTDEGGALPVRPRRDLALEVGGQADGVAQQGDPLGLAAVAAGGELTRLGEGEDGLAAAGAAADLEATQQPGDAQDLALLLGEAVGAVGALVRLVHEAAGGIDPASGEDRDEE